MLDAEAEDPNETRQIKRIVGQQWFQLRGEVQSSLSASEWTAGSFETDRFLADCVEFLRSGHETCDKR